MRVVSKSVSAVALAAALIGGGAAAANAAPAVAVPASTVVAPTVVQDYLPTCGPSRDGEIRSYNGNDFICQHNGSTWGWDPYWAGDSGGDSTFFA